MKKYSFSSHPTAKVGRLWYLGTQDFILIFIYLLIIISPLEHRLVVVGELACLSDLESFSIGGSTLAGWSKGRGQTKL